MTDIQKLNLLFSKLSLCDNEVEANDLVNKMKGLRLDNTNSDLNELIHHFDKLEIKDDKIILKSRTGKHLIIYRTCKIDSKWNNFYPRYGTAF